MCTSRQTEISPIHIPRSDVLRQSANCSQSEDIAMKVADDANNPRYFKMLHELQYFEA